MTDRTYTRVDFQPADFCALGSVKVYSPDGTLIRTIPVAALRNRESAVPVQQPPGHIPPREEFPEYRAAKKGRVRRA